MGVLTFVWIQNGAVVKKWDEDTIFVCLALSHDCVGNMNKVIVKDTYIN